MVQRVDASAKPRRRSSLHTGQNGGSTTALGAGAESRLAPQSVGRGGVGGWGPRRQAVCAQSPAFVSLARSRCCNGGALRGLRVAGQPRHRAAAPTTSDLCELNRSVCKRASSLNRERVAAVWMPTMRSQTLSGRRRWPSSHVHACAEVRRRAGPPSSHSACRRSGRRAGGSSTVVVRVCVLVLTSYFSRGG